MRSTPADRRAGLYLLLLLGSLPGCRDAGVPVEEPSPAAPAAWFTEIAGEVGVEFEHAGGAAGTYATPENLGSGGALFDYDGDGDLDVYLIDITAASRALENRLFRQDTGGSFTDVTAVAGVGDRGYGMGAAVGDVDNDGDADLFVSNLGADALYLNRGDGGFRFAGAAAAAAGFDADLWSTSACFLDYDRDGRLDLYVATYLRFEPDKDCTDSAGNPEFCGPEAFRGIPDRLFRGLGDGNFKEVSDLALPSRPANKALGVICTDLDDDAFPDIYVANDGEENQLWINQGDGTFREQALLRGAALNTFGRPEASMGVVAGDLDGDLDPDLFMTHLDRETNTFYANLGDATFEDRTPATGLGPASMPHTGFGTALLDADLDGDLDLALVNGRVRRGASLSEREARQRSVRADASVPSILAEYVEPNMFFVNEGDGRFRDASAEAGWRSEAAAVSRGLLAGDLDLDGDPDLLVTNCGSHARLYRNDLPGRGRWLAVEALEATRAGAPSAALGARVWVVTGTKRQALAVTSAQGYLAATEPRAHFGLGGAERVDRLELRWLDGGRTVLEDIPSNRAVRVVRRSTPAGGRDE